MFPLALALIFIGSNAVPIEEVNVTNMNFGEVMESRLTKLKNSLTCFYNGNMPLVPGSYGPSPKRESLNQPDWITDLNITRLEIIGVDKFEVLKSVYDKDTKKYELEVKFNESRLEGAYSINDNANFTYLGFYFKGSSNFTIRTFPAILKIGWVFTNDEETHELTIKDFYEYLEPVDPERETVSILEDIFKGAPKEILEMRDTLMMAVTEFTDSLKDVIIKKTEKSFQMSFKKYTTVEELANMVYAGPPETSLLYKIYDCLDNKI